MAEIKTKKNDGDVMAFINALPEERKRADALAIIEMMRKATGHEPVMWGTAIVGFDQYHYKYDSGHEADMCLIGFSPRKQNLTLYITQDFDKYEALLSKLGKHKTSKACIYINKLSDVDTNLLQKLISATYKDEKKKLKK
ncbi:hypothetical protein CAP35_06715 [Chitinophagaceae bacterium IBVUCB1]|nr:hypothetical protein CAP35_06715 [Chitinophagaceae bacterium IBVUCB1]